MFPEELLGERLYANPLSSARDLNGFIAEGDAGFSFPLGRWRLEGTRDPGQGQAANVVVWCPVDFPDHVHISWNYRAIQDPGLSILFFSAKGRNGEDVLDPALAPRNGPYNQYHSGDINALHVSYFRRKHLDERAFTTCNLRKSHGFHLVAQGADPIPSIADQKEAYRIWLIKSGSHVRFGVDDLECFRWTDPGGAFGPVLGGGKIGFRQMTPLIAEYWDLQVHQLKEPL
ncbi:DUF1961 family protein [Cerasicoccus frondis]|uniref:DUF1961 family protein n=1 Tax=Cerasicoccus frondis TaxID=490090 RepID=UPI0028526750|nr:DUF1961 family protein [Cerasicoccus frondis]